MFVVLVPPLLLLLLNRTLVALQRNILIVNLFMLSEWTFAEEKECLEDLTLTQKSRVLVCSHDIMDVIKLFPSLSEYIANGTNNKEEITDIMGRIHLLKNTIPTIKEIYEWAVHKSVGEYGMFTKLIILISTNELVHFEKKYTTMAENFSLLNGSNRRAGEEVDIALKIFVFHKHH